MKLYIIFFPKCGNKKTTLCIRYRGLTCPGLKSQEPFRLPARIDRSGWMCWSTNCTNFENVSCFVRREICSLKNILPRTILLRVHFPQGDTRPDSHRGLVCPGLELIALSGRLPVIFTLWPKIIGVGTTNDRLFWFIFSIVVSTRFVRRDNEALYHFFSKV